jgi:hypothetical protein
MDKTNEIKDIIALENTRASTNTVGGADDITGFTSELENAPKRAFRESDTGKDVLKREELMLMKVDGCEFDILLILRYTIAGRLVLHRNNYFSSSFPKHLRCHASRVTTIVSESLKTCDTHLRRSLNNN